DDAKPVIDADSGAEPCQSGGDGAPGSGVLPPHRHDRMGGQDGDSRHCRIVMAKVDGCEHAKGEKSQTREQPAVDYDPERIAEALPPPSQADDPEREERPRVVS